MPTIVHTMQGGDERMYIQQGTVKENLE